MNIKLYNSYSRKKELFKPINPGKVGLYTCGPTVYDFAHIGNFRTFIFEDLLKRWLIHTGYEVTHIMNITDVDDKTIKMANDLNVDLNIITEGYTEQFMNDLRWLKILPADNYPRATKSIDKMIEIIENLIDKGHAYTESDGSVYFNISTFSDYGRLARISKKGQAKSNRIKDDEYDKNSPQDFALWKGWKKEDGEIGWDAPWGKGRPGWHIECSAMSSENLGNHFDIHCGGVDNIFPHHENEIAQSICSSGEKFVNYWLHSEFLLVDGGKMSKSLGNCFTVSDLVKKGFTAESIRYQLLAGHYRTKISFSLKKKQESDKVISRINEFQSMLIDLGAQDIQRKELPDSFYDFVEAMNDDLNTPKALGIFHSWMRRVSKKIKADSISKIEIGEAWNFLTNFDMVFGFLSEKTLKIPLKIEKLLQLREAARAENNWTFADDLRDQIQEEGWKVEDTPKGQKVKKTNY
ncbi:MAG: cysteine--tRNA ligase [Candidatus Neomarinimicrobiota bacterium]